jgi:hypothetical protein
MKRIAFALATVLLVCSSLFAAAPPKKDVPSIFPVPYSFFTINYPHSSYNYLYGINDTGYIAGETSFNSFVVVPSEDCPPKCTFKTVNYPGSIYTGVVGINNDEQPSFELAGYWSDKTGNGHGFMHNANAWIDVDYPGTTGNELCGVNDNDVAAGSYEDGTYKFHPYIYSQPGNQFIPLFIPGSDDAFAAGINDYNVVVGTYWDSSGFAHGFEFSPFFTELDYPGASYTYATGINNYGAIVGYFYDGTGGAQGFVYYGGTWEPLDDPDATDGTFAYGINDYFDIVGWSYTANGAFGWEAFPE